MSIKNILVPSAGSHEDTGHSFTRLIANVYVEAIRAGNKPVLHPRKVPKNIVFDT
jgi:hypothetical protein